MQRATAGRRFFTAKNSIGVALEAEQKQIKEALSDTERAIPRREGLQ